jgi:hypothetical protein
VYRPNCSREKFLQIGDKSDYSDGMINLMSNGLMNQSKGGIAGYFKPGSTLSTFGWGSLFMGFLLFVSLICNAVFLIKIKSQNKGNTSS